MTQITPWAQPAPHTAVPTLPELPGMHWDLTVELAVYRLKLLKGHASIGSVLIDRRLVPGDISCFVIYDDHQGQGLALHLLRGALACGGTQLYVAGRNLPAVRTYRHHLQWQPGTDRMYVPGTQPDGVTLLALPRDPDVSFVPAALLALHEAAEQELYRVCSPTYTEDPRDDLEIFEDYEQINTLIKAVRCSIPSSTPLQTAHLWMSGLSTRNHIPTQAVIVPDALRAQVDAALKVAPDLARFF